MIEEPLRGLAAPPETTGLVLVSRQRLFRDCLSARFATSKAFRVAAECGELEEAVVEARRRDAQLLLVDGSSLDDGGYSLLAGLQDLKTVVLGVPDGLAELRRCAEAGIHGFVYRDTPLEELTATLAAVARGRRVCGPRAARAAFGRVARLALRDHRRDRMEVLALTPRQMEVLRLMAQGLGNVQIAGRLGLSHYTVKNHVHNILERLDVRDRTEAVAHAYRRRWLP